MEARYLNFDDELIVASPSTPKTTTAVEREEESETDRIRREQEASEALARAMMAEEATLVYQNQIQMMRENPEHLSEEDMAAIRALEEQDRLEEERERAAELGVDSEGELSYDALLNLGEHIGDVRKERWALEAQKHIDNLPLETYDAESGDGSDAHNDSEVKCLVCQHEYQRGDRLRRLPCGHIFHAECVDEWLKTNDECLYCRKSIVEKQNKE